MNRIIWERALGILLMSGSFVVMCFVIAAVCFGLVAFAEWGA